MKNITHTNTTESPQATLGIIDIISLVQLTAVFVVGTFGNLLVVYVFGWKKRKRRRPFALLLLILGIVDFLASFLIPTLFIYGTVTFYQHWHFGFYGCKIIQSIFPMTITISQGTLVLISYERYRVITNPFRRQLSKPFIFVWLTILLVLSMLIVSPYTKSLKIIVDDTYSLNTCMPTGANQPELFIFSIANILRDISSTIVLVTFGILSRRVMNVDDDSLVSSYRVNRKAQNARKARKMLIIVALVFTVCVVPLDLFQLIIYSLFQADPKTIGDHYKFIMSCNTFLTTIQICNSATNVIIYSKMHKDFTRNLFRYARKSGKIIRSSISRFSIRSTITSNFEGDDEVIIEEVEVNDNAFV